MTKWPNNDNYNEKLNFFIYRFEGSRCVMKTPTPLHRHDCHKADNVITVPHTADKSETVKKVAFLCIWCFLRVNPK